jgi:predicted transcriptional regulator of viral defense system
VRFLEFKAHFKPFKVFSIQDVKKWDSKFDSRRLVEWQDKNYVTKLINRWYLFSDEGVDEKLLYLVANRVYSPSYVSLESALSYHQLIPEGVFSVTSVSSLVTRSFDTPLGRFVFRHLRPELFFGYQLLEFDGQRIKMAEPEKVILDYLYLSPSLVSEADMKSLRLNNASFIQRINVNRLENYLRLFQNKQLEKRVGRLLTVLGHA